MDQITELQAGVITAAEAFALGKQLIERLERETAELAAKTEDWSQVLETSRRGTYRLIMMGNGLAA